MDTIQISIKANENQQELLISQLADMNTNGFEQTDTHLIAYFPEAQFPSYDIYDLLKDYEYESITLKERNWNEEWELNFKPVIVSDFCTVRADFHKVVQSTKYELIITPKMSFGTGHHATTYMMIDQMKDLDFNNKKVFDFGTGTGILAILAEKLGASAIKAIDVDEWSIENTRENIERNECNRVTVELTSLLPEDQFDIILANINRNVILQYLPQLKKVLNNGGILLLSGLMVSDEEIIQAECKRNSLIFNKRTEKDNWISLLFVNEL